MDQIQNVERLSEGFFSNLLNYGSIKIYLNATSALKTITFVPNAKYHFRCINRIIEERRKLTYKDEEKQILEKIS